MAASVPAVREGEVGQRKRGGKRKSESEEKGEKSRKSLFKATQDGGGAVDHSGEGKRGSFVPLFRAF